MQTGDDAAMLGCKGEDERGKELHRNKRRNVVLCCAVLCCAVLCRAMLCCAVSRCAVLYCVVFCRVVLCRVCVDKIGGAGLGPDVAATAAVVGKANMRAWAAK
eukprot:919268-Rhodomonas_salina.2